MALWNVVHGIYVERMGSLGPLASQVAEELRWDSSRFTQNAGALVQALRAPIQSDAKSWDFYDLIEIVARRFSGLPGYVGGLAGYWNRWNRALQEEGAAFRFVNGELVPLTNESEAQEVELALRSPLHPIREHIGSALKKLAEKPMPDTRNAIKEAISAVEGALKVLAERNKGDLRDALPEFEAKYGKFHGAFRGALEKLYGYTSDEKGVRHSLLDEDANVDLDDARFMVIACSAFSNFLVARATSRGWQP